MEKIKNITQLPEKRVSLVRVMAVKEKEVLYGGKTVRIVKRLQSWEESCWRMLTGNFCLCAVWTAERIRSA